MSKIDIKTTQQVTIEYELAPLSERIFAFFIDAALMWGLMLLLHAILLPRTTFLGNHFLTYLLILPIFFFYSLFFEALMDGQSPGKRIFGIKVVKLTGQEANLNDYILRWSFRMIDIYLSMGAVASLMIGSSPKHQRLGDLLANTAVIKVKSSYHLRLQDILKINSIENYEISYPEVRLFSEKEMLFMKNTLNRYQRYPNSAHKLAIHELSEKVRSLIGLESVPNDRILFIKTLIRDYIVLTR